LRGRVQADYADALRAKLALKRQHVLTGQPDRDGMIALLNAHFEQRDARSSDETMGSDGAVCWALDVENPIRAATIEAADESAAGIAWELPRRAFHHNQSFFVHDNEDHWQLRRLAWLSSLADDELWHVAEHTAPVDACLTWDPTATLEVYLRFERSKPAAQRELVHAMVEAMLDHDCWSVMIPSLGLLTIVHGRELNRGMACQLRVRDDDLPAPFELG
jgi:hypothetical protein